ncbi:Threonine aspartase 1 [Harpegnathos saltator]|uniref:Threonine aspartase 1 n=1 Tax=Harpegnathos saltator TaxID=610380 RepID=E2B381_HARSA|nr:Threonine aspartase 1 [Harpegnathos saltator]
MSNIKQGFIAVHVGAGQHSASLKEKYQKLCREACKVGTESLKSGDSALDAVVKATVALEDSPMTNAGFGSNLTLNGTVECDASVMDGSSLQFGAVGAVSGIKNPVLLAKRLCEQQSIKFPYGRIPPSFLVGNGAHIWAHEMGIQTLPPEQLISMRAQKIYKHYKRKVEDNSVEIQKAGVWGCGAWACKDTSYSIGASTSGCGEHLVRTSLARTIAEAISDTSCPTTSLHRSMNADFIDSKFLDGLEQKLGGVIAIRYSPQEGLGDFLWSHSTNSMIIGYMNTCENAPVSYMSVLPSSEVGKKAVVEGVCFKIRLEA